MLGMLVGLDDQNLRMLRSGAGRGGMQVQLAEAAAERLVLVVGELLVAKEDHQVRHQCVVNFLKGLVAEWLGEVDTEKLRTEPRRELADLYCLVAPLLFL